MVDGSKRSKNKRWLAKGQASKGILNVSIDSDNLRNNTTTLNVVSTIFGGPQIGDSNNKRKKYTRQILKLEYDHYVNFVALDYDEPTNLHKAIHFMKDEA